MGGRLASLYPQLGTQAVAALALWSPANGTGLQGLEFLNIEDFSQVEAVAAEAEANGQAGTNGGVEISADFVRQMRESDPNAALRACGLPVLLTYSGQDAVLSEATMGGGHGVHRAEPARRHGGDRAVRAGRPQLQQRRRGGGRAAGRRPLPHHHGVFNSAVENLKRRKTESRAACCRAGFPVPWCGKTKRPRPVAAPGGGIWGISFGVRRIMFQGSVAAPSLCLYNTR